MNPRPAWAATARPNVVVLHCHDLGRFLPCYGIGTVRAPQLDALAAEAVVFEQAFCVAPQCSPARAALFTGRFPHANGVLGLTGPAFGWDLHPDEEHLAAALHRAGYRTGLIGVHHESRTGAPDLIAERLGFDSVDPGGHAASVADRAVAALADHAADRSRPFYLQIGFTEPHRLTGPDEHADHLGFRGDHLDPDDELGVTVPAHLIDEPSARVEIAELQGAIRHMDEQLGRVLHALRRHGLTDDTIVVFTTDHGLAFPGAKGTLYDPGLAVSLMIRYPRAGWNGGRRSRALVSHLDVVPTVLAAVGVGPRRELHGEDLAPVLDGSADDTRRDQVFGEITYHAYYDPRRCLRTRTHKLIANFATAARIHDTSQSWRPRTRPVVPAADPRAARNDAIEYYDLLADPHETRNLAAEAGDGPPPELLARLGAWMRDTGDPLTAGAVAAPVDGRARRAIGLWTTPRPDRDDRP